MLPSPVQVGDYVAFDPVLLAERDRWSRAYYATFRGFVADKVTDHYSDGTPSVSVKVLWFNRNDRTNVYIDPRVLVSVPKRDTKHLDHRKV